MGAHHQVLVHPSEKLEVMDEVNWRAQPVPHTHSDLDESYYQTVAHEFGHMLGMRDEYLLDAEKAYFLEQFKDPLFCLRRWTLDLINPCDDRIRERLASGKKCESVEPSLMEKQISFPFQVFKAFPSHIKAICEGKQQDLCWHPRLLKLGEKLKPGLPDWLK